MNDTGDPDLQHKLSQISLEKCILVELLNEKDENDRSLLHIAFINWLENDEDIKNIDDVIICQKELKMYWTQFEMNSLVKMKRKLKDCNYSIVAVRVLAYGNYCDMANKLKNLEAGYEKTPLKKNRSTMKKKQDDDYVSTNLKRIKLDKENKKKNFNGRKKHVPVNVVSEPKSAINISALAVSASVNLKKKLHETKKMPMKSRENVYGEIYTDSSESNDLVSPTLKNNEDDNEENGDLQMEKSTEPKASENKIDEIRLSKTLEVDHVDNENKTVEKKIKNKVDNENDYEEYLSDDFLNEKVKSNHTFEEEHADTKEDNEDEFESLLKEKDTKIESLQQQICDMKKEKCNVLIENEALKTLLHKEQTRNKEMIDKLQQNASASAYAALRKVYEIAGKELNTLNVDENGPDDKRKAREYTYRHESYDLVSETPSTYVKKEKVSTGTEKCTKRKKDHVEIPFRKDPTTYEIPYKIEKEVSKQTSIRGFANTITDLLFSTDELAVSSVTGVPSNALKKQEARPALDQNKLNAARNLCGKYHAATKGWKAVFNQAVGGKCSAARAARKSSKS